MNAKSLFSWCQLAFPKGLTLVGPGWGSEAVERRACMNAKDRRHGYIRVSTGSKSVSGPKASDGRHECRMEIARLIALLLSCGTVGTAVSACASYRANSLNSTPMSALSGCPGQEGYPDCQPN
jgi:hypothetical protein